MASKQPVCLNSSVPPSAENLARSRDRYAALRARKDLGFQFLTERDDLWKSAARLGKEWRKKFELLVLIGIGGSSLGPQTIEDLFGEERLLVLDNVDPVLLDQVEKKINKVGWDKTGFLVVSKSGTTMETAAIASHVVRKLAEASLSAQERVAVVTEPGSNPLRRWADQQGCVALDVPVDVGGRFSVLSPVGMMPAAFIGLDPEEFRRGAKDALGNDAGVVEMMARALDSFERREWLTVGFFYSSRMRSFGGWWQQLWAESLAKKSDRSGLPGPAVSTPMCAVGACDQHSLLQQMMEGVRDKWVIFTRFRSLSSKGPVIDSPLFPEVNFMQGHRLGHILNVESESTREGLARTGVSVMELEIEDMSPYTLGYLFMYWQLVVGGLGEVLNIDAFTQPGVELAKRLARENLVRP